MGECQCRSRDAWEILRYRDKIVSLCGHVVVRNAVNFYKHLEDISSTIVLDGNCLDRILRECYRP